jgi:hypothetical protein
MYVISVYWNSWSYIRKNVFEIKGFS